MNHVGFTAAIADADRAALTARLAPFVGGSGFAVNIPGGPSRGQTARSTAWVPLYPELVVEVTYDQVTSGRFRHGTDLVRWRSDKAAAQCTMDQLAPALRPAELAAIVAA